MKKTFWLVLVPTIALLASVGWWLTDGGTPPAPQLAKAPATGAATDAPPAQGPVRGVAAVGPRVRPPPPRSPEDSTTVAPALAATPSRLDVPEPGEATAYNLADPADRQALVEALRAQGVAEQDLQQVLGRPANTPTAEPGEARVYALNEPADRELLVESMRANAVSEEDLQYVLNSSADDPGAVRATPDPTEAQVYNMADPADRQAFAGSLAAQGVREEEMASVMTDGRDRTP